MRKDVMFADDINDLPAFLYRDDIIARRDELREEKADYEATPEDADPSVDWSEDKDELLKALEELADSNCDNFVSDSEWVDYCRQYAYDSGTIEQDSAIDNYVDWQGWADAMQSDFTVVEVGGTTYYGR